MNFYSQYGEDRIISSQKSKIGNILEIGANDGITLSNSLHFIEEGWGATLVEAAPIAFSKLCEIHRNNERVQCIKSCLDDCNREVIFYHNKTHLSKGDTDLLSTIKKESYLDSNRNFEFEEIKMFTETFEQLTNKLKYNSYEIISIDVEGIDLEILQQIDLNQFSCNFLIIEYNNDNTKKNKIIDYTHKFGMNKILLDNKTNLILMR